MRKWKRCLAGLLAVATVFTSSNIAYAAESLSNEKWSTTTAGIVANAYFGSDSESDIAARTVLESDVLEKGDSYEIQVPTSDTLVDVDSANKVVYAEAYQDGGYNWIPKTAEIVPAEENGTTSTVSFGETPEGGKYKSEAYDAGITSCTVNVTYTLTMTVAEREQQEVLDRLTNLAEGLTYANTLETVGSDIAALNAAFAQMGISSPVGATLCEYADRVTTPKIEYLIKNRDAIKAAASEAQAALELLKNAVEPSKEIESAYETVAASLQLLSKGCVVMDAPEKVFADNNYGDAEFEQYVEKIESVNREISESLTVASTVISKTANVKTVNIEVIVEVPKDAAVADFGDVTAEKLTYQTKVVFPKDTELNDAKVLISETAEDALGNAAASDETWKGYADKYNQFAVKENGGYFTYEAPEISEVTDDMTYTVTYKIDRFTVNTELEGQFGTIENVPYGTKLELPRNASASNDYDYVVTADGKNTYYSEGKVLEVTKNLTIKRSQSTKKMTKSLLSMLSSDTQYTGLAAAKGFMSSKALKSPTVTIRQPGNVAVNVSMETGNTYAATASSIQSGIAEMVWVPETAKVMNGKTKVETNVVRTAGEDGQFTFTWETADKFTHLEVQYVLEVTRYEYENTYVELTDAEIERYLNLPKSLVENVKEQNNVLSKMKEVYDTIEDDDALKLVMTKMALNALKSDLSPKGKEAVDVILTKGVTKNEVTLYTYLKRCNDVNWQLSSYFANGYADVMKEQIAILVPQLKVIANDENLQNALDKFGVNYTAEEVRSKIVDFNGKLDDLNIKNAEEVSTNTFLMDDVAAFDKLIQEILKVDANSLQANIRSNGVKAYTSVSAPAPTQGTYTIIVQDVDGNTVNGVVIYEREEGQELHTVTADDVAQIEATLQELAVQLGIPAEKYFLTNKEEAVPAVGSTVSFEHVINYVYSERTYTVKVNGTEPLSFKGTDSAVITLPAPTDEDTYYVYIITEGETKTEVKVYPGTNGTYKVEKISELADGTLNLSVERKLYSVKTDSIDQFVNALNDAMKAEPSLKDAQGNLMAGFLPVKDFATYANGTYSSLILRLDYSSVSAADALFRAIGNAMVDIAVSTPYVAFEGNTEKFLYSDENGVAVDIQAMVNLFLNSGIGTDSFVQLIDESGSVRNNVSANGVVKDGVLAANAEIGGKLFESSIQLGNDAEDYQSLPLTVALAGKNSEYLKGIRNFFDKVDEYGSLTMKDGKIALNARIPQNAYTVYLSVMLLLGELDLDQINDDLTIKNQALDLRDLLLENLEAGDVTYKTVENTINKYLNTNYDLSNYESVVNRIVDLLEKAKGDIYDSDVVSNSTIEVTLKVNLEKVLDNHQFSSMLATTKLSVPMSFKVENFENDIEAIVLDLGKPGTVNKLQYVTDLADALEKAEGLTYVVLTKNIENSALTIKKPTVLNLNGNTVLYSINAGDNELRIVDSVYNSESLVYGIVSGSKVRISGGAYPEMVNEANKEALDKMLGENYKIEDDRVKGKYYDLVEKDGKIEVRISSDVAGMTEGNMQMILIDILSDLFFNLYDVAGLTIDGKRIISADAENILSDIVAKDYSELADKIKNIVDKENASEFITDLIGKFNDLEKLAALVEKGGTIASYEVQTHSWGVSLNVNSSENIFDLGLKTKVNDPKTVEFLFAEPNKEVAVELRQFAEIFSVDYAFTYGGYEFKDGKLNLKGSADVKVLLDLENEDGTPSAYITALGAILAYNEENPAKLAEAIANYENNVYAGDLRAAIEGMSIGKLINAVKKAETVEFEDLLRETGLRNLITDAYRLEKSYQTFIKTVYNLADYAEKGIRFTEDKTNVKIFDRTLGGVKDVTEDGYWCTYGGDFNYSDNVKLDVRMKMFSGKYNTLVDEAIKRLSEVPKDLKQIYQENGEDHREEYLDVISAARAAYDAVDSAYRFMIPQELYQRLLDAEGFYNQMGVWVAPIEAVDYTGKAIKPANDQVRVYHGSKLLTYKKDYTLSYKNNTNAAGKDAVKAPQVTVSLKKNYSGTIYTYFTIKQIDLSRAMTDETYRTEVGLEVRDVEVASTTSLKKTNFGKPTVYLNGKKISTSEYTLAYPENPNSDKKEPIKYKATGSYPVTVTGKDKNFTGTYTATQHVADKKMSSVSVKLINPETGKKATSFAYTGSAIEPQLQVTYKQGKTTYTLTEGVHFTVDRQNNVNVGTAAFVLTGTGNSNDEAPISFYGTKKVTFKITATMTLSSSKKASDKYATVTMLPEEGMKNVTKTYCGKAIELEAGKDFKVTIGKEDPQELIFGTDYTVTYKKNDKAGTATITFKGIGAYKGSVSKTFKIEQVVLTEDFLMTDHVIVVPYESRSTKPANSALKLQFIDTDTNKVIQTLKAGKDYTVSYKNTTQVAAQDEAGVYGYANPKKQPSLTVKGKGNFKGSFTLEYQILPGEMEVSAKDITVAVSKSGLYSYKPSVTVTNAVTGKKLSSVANFTYEVKEGDEWKPVTESAHYDAKKKKVALAAEETELLMRVAATAKAGKGLRTETVYAEYTLSTYQKALSKAKVTFDKTKLVYDKYEKTIENAVTVQYKIGKTWETLEAGKDYVIEETSYTNNLFAGTASVKLTGIGVYGGTVTKKFTISKFSLGRKNIALGNGDDVALYLDQKKATAENADTLLQVVYVKGGVKPADKIKLTSKNPLTGEEETLVYGRDYTLSWKNNSKVAAYDAKNAPYVTIKGKGNYTGTLKVKFTIVSELSNQ